MDIKKFYFYLDHHRFNGTNNYFNSLRKSILGEVEIFEFFFRQETLATYRDVLTKEYLKLTKLLSG